MSNHAILTAETHRDLRVRPERAPELGDGVMCCLTVPAEFRQVQNEYPILFRLDADRESFAAYAMFGFENGENLFLDNGRWDARYRPLAIDIQPFLIGQADASDADKQVHVDMASPRIATSEGVRVFDDTGRPTPYLETMAEKLGTLDAGYQATADFMTALRARDLLEPMSLDITLNDGSTNRLVGFHVIDEDKLRALDADDVADLHAKGYLMPIFMAVASLSNITDLVARKNKRAGNV